jgi:hypothetical protein
VAGVLRQPAASDTAKQRGAKAQPGGRRAGSGGLPAIGASFVPLGASSSGMLRNSEIV